MGKFLFDAGLEAYIETFKATLASFVSSDIREIGPVWDNGDRPVPSQSVVRPAADRAEFTVISSYPVAVVEKAQSEQQPRRVASTVRTLERGEFRPTARDLSMDPVLERYPGLLDLWTPFTEDPVANARSRKSKRPLFVPDTGYLLEH